MPITSPDNLYSPNSGDQYNLITDWAASMSSVQAALISRSTAIGTTSERNSTVGVQGGLWYDTDYNRVYVWSDDIAAPGIPGSGWIGVGPEIRHGIYTVTGNGTSSVTATISYGTPFESTSLPTVITTPLTAAGDNTYVGGAYVTDSRQSDFDVRVKFNTNWTASYWIRWAAFCG